MASTQGTQQNKPLSLSSCTHVPPPPLLQSKFIHLLLSFFNTVPTFHSFSRKKTQKSCPLWPENMKRRRWWWWRRRSSSVAEELYMEKNGDLSTQFEVVCYNGNSCDYTWKETSDSTKDKSPSSTTINSCHHNSIRPTFWMCHSCRVKGDVLY